MAKTIEVQPEQLPVVVQALGRIYSETRNGATLTETNRRADAFMDKMMEIGVAQRIAKALPKRS